MHDERIAARPALGGENTGDCPDIERIGPKAIHRFGGKCNQAALAQNGNRLSDGVGISRQHFGQHGTRLQITICKSFKRQNRES